MKFNLITTKEIGYELVANERAICASVPGNLARYYVKFENAEIIEGGCLISTFGNGNTIDEAIKNYCIEISNRRIAFNSHTYQRKEIVFPKLVHTKLIGQ